MPPGQDPVADTLESLLPRVTRPARYTGGEWNAVRKDHRSVDVLFALAFPEVYEIGMSHLGSLILYDQLNRREDTACERVYAPWVDMEAELRRTGLPLFALESRRSVAEFDILGISLQYEMNFTNVLNLLDLAGIPLAAAERDAGHPLVLAGGPCALNPEPLAPFLDAIVLGEGEEVIHEVVDACRDDKRRGSRSRGNLLRRLAAIPGVYVPSLYQVTYRPDGKLATFGPAVPGVPERVRRRWVRDLDRTPHPLRPVVPYSEIVHDRAMVEVFRGCTRGCRFCQAGTIYRPVRERSPDQVCELARQLIDATGHQELSLAALSASDYSAIEDTVRRLVDQEEGRGVGISLPSLRADAFSVGLAHQVQRVRKTGLTFAPEAGTQRLRDVINKGVTEHDLRQAMESAFRSGWHAVKLYFMIGLPTERQEDLDGLVDLIREAEGVYREVTGGKGRQLKLGVSIAPFVPKAHTPFQWEPQCSLAELEERQSYLRRRTPRRVRLSWHDPHVSRVEAVFARGDRRLAPAIREAWAMGARFDGWSEQFDYRRWLGAFAGSGIEPAHYAERPRDQDELLPWDHLDCGVDKEFLWRERERAFAGLPTPDCRWAACTACGACHPRAAATGGAWRKAGGGEDPSSGSG
ncbi:MAG TPA: TIGR03960 family B12-binding radical SAM protein [Clostridiales bacterium]|nr:TIGR03960 family B12-binding radical SAM protein [Clostridiales bacterium]